MSAAAFWGEEDASDALSGVPPDRRKTKLTGQETLTPELLRKRRSRARRHCFRGGKARSQAVVAAQALMVPQQLPHSQAVVAAQALMVPQQLSQSLPGSSVSCGETLVRVDAGARKEGVAASSSGATAAPSATGSGHVGAAARKDAVAASSSGASECVGARRKFAHVDGAVENGGLSRGTYEGIWSHQVDCLAGVIAPLDLNSATSGGSDRAATCIEAVAALDSTSAAAAARSKGVAASSSGATALAALGSKSATLSGGDSAAACIEALATPDSKSATAGSGDSAAACIEALAAPDSTSATSVGGAIVAAFGDTTGGPDCAAAHSSGVADLSSVGVDSKSAATAEDHGAAVRSGAASYSHGAASHSSGVVSVAATYVCYNVAAQNIAAALSEEGQLIVMEWLQWCGRRPIVGRWIRWHGTLNHAKSGYGGEKGSEGGGEPPSPVAGARERVSSANVTVVRLCGLGRIPGLKPSLFLARWH